jgi:hypothetical protein
MRSTSLPAGSTSPARRFFARSVALFVVTLFSLSVVSATGCGEDEPSANRRCSSGFRAYVPNAALTCGEESSLDLEYCETTPLAGCTETAPAVVCLASPGDTGYLVELSPCGTLQSLPDGWSFGEDYRSGIRAARQCQQAATRCSDGAVIWTPKDDGAAGTGGAGGNGGAAGQPSAGNGGAAGQPSAGNGGAAGQPGTGNAGAAGQPSAGNGGAAGQPSAGSGGAAGQPSAGNGGVAGNAGAAGQPSAGNAGASGSLTGGSAGSAGDAGNAGDGGTAGNAGDGGTAGDAGNAGDSGAAGDAGSAGDGGTAGSGG